MTEYIERKKAIAIVRKYLVESDDSPRYSYYAERLNDFISDVVSEIEEIPAANVRPERHGHWISHGHCLPIADYGICSECGADYNIYDTGYVAYCPGCGAKMDGKDGESD